MVMQISSLLQQLITQRAWTGIERRLWHPVRNPGDVPYDAIGSDKLISISVRADDSAVREALSTQDSKMT